MTEQDTNFVAPLTKHFYRSKSTLDSLKSVFNAFRRKSSLSALESWKWWAYIVLSSLNLRMKDEELS